VHIEIDTGMTRGGFSSSSVVAAAQRLAGAGVRIGAVWSHLATPEDEDITREQVQRFESAVAAVRQAGIDPPLKHISASAGLACGAPAYDLARVGLAFYGLHPGPPSSELEAVRRIRPALSIRARPVRIADVEPGASVGYGGTWVAGRASRIATLPLGYADGWLRGSGPRTQALVRGRRAPVVGRISSDSMTVDVTDVPGVEESDLMILLGGDGSDAITADDVAEARGTITWEVLQTLSRRLPRVYLLDEGVVAIRRYDRGRLTAVPDLRARLEHAAAIIGTEAST
jgi:alanine racemase